VSPEVVYDPPYGGQALRVRGTGKAWDRTATFLTRCTDADPSRPETVDLSVYEPAARERADWYEPTLRAAESAFGPGERFAWLIGASEAYRIDWRLPSEDTSRALAFLTDGEPWPKTVYGPIALTLTFRFRWVDPETDVALPGLEADPGGPASQAASSIMVFLRPQSSAILTARFPFSTVGSEFLTFLARVAPYTPMPLLSSRFRLRIPTRRPSEVGFVTRRIGDTARLDDILRRRPTRRYS
jgi:hypothetical protein